MRSFPVLLALVAFVALPGVLVAGEAVAWSFGYPALPAIEALTGPWCHHDPARTLTVSGALLPVCARCTGLYGGLILGPLLGAALPYRGPVLAWVASLAMAPVVVGLLAAFAEAIGVWSTSNPTRLALGLMLTLGPAALGIVGSRILAEALAEAATRR